MEYEDFWLDLILPKMMQNVSIASNLIFIVVGLIGGCLFLSNVSDKEANLWMPVHPGAYVTVSKWQVGPYSVSL